MRKFILCSSITVAFVFYAIYQAHNTPEVSIISPAPLAVNQEASITSSTPVEPPPAPVQVPSPAPVTPVPSAPSLTRSNAPVAGSSPKPTLTPVKTPAPAPIPKPTPAPVLVKKPAGQYQDGQYTGSVADAYYGNVQVSATIQNGKITSVQFLQYPSDRSTSRYLNSQAMPYLQQEAIAAQSANVDTVSGASDTSAAFKQSLSAALSQAKG